MDAAQQVGSVALEKDAEAAAEFRKITERPANSLSLRYAPAQGQLARAMVLAGDKAAAKKAYERFFALWKEADADIPRRAAARNEYAAFQGHVN